MKFFKILAVSTLLTSLNAQAAFFIVDRFEDAPDEFTGNGVCAATGLVGNRCSLRAAIMEANDLPGADVILVPANGEFILSRLGEENFGLIGDLDISSEITLTNGTSGMNINGNGTDRIFHIHSGGNLTLENATLKNGVANSVTSFEGGAVKIETGGSFSTNEVTFVNNLANRGGAIFNDGGLTIENSYFHHNAVTNENTPQNLSSVGSALLNRNILLFATSTVSHNGQLLSNPGNAVMTGAQYAMHFNPNGNNALPPLSFIFNSTIANNGYGGIRSDRGFTDINQSTIAFHDSRGIRFTRNDNEDGVLQLKFRKSLVVNNGFQDCNDLQDLPANETDLIDNYNGSSGASCGFSGFNDRDDMLNPFNGSLHMWGGYAPTLMLLQNSMASDRAGMDCTDEDQRGTARPLDSNNDTSFLCDMGAVEFNPLTDPTESDIIFKHGFDPVF